MCVCVFYSFLIWFYNPSITLTELLGLLAQNCRQHIWDNSLPLGRLATSWTKRGAEWQDSIWDAPMLWQKFEVTGNGIGIYGIWNGITNAKTFAICVLPTYMRDPPSTLSALRGRCLNMPWKKQNLQQNMFWFLLSCTPRYTDFEAMRNFPRMTVAQWYLFSLKNYVNPLCVSWHQLSEKHWTLLLYSKQQTSNIRVISCPGSHRILSMDGEILQQLGWISIFVVQHECERLLH